MKSVPATEVEMTSTPAKALERAISKDQLLASKATLRELIEKLLSPKFDRVRLTRTARHSTDSVGASARSRRDRADHSRVARSN